MKKLTSAQLIAPCGINCCICLGYLRDKNKCEGCRSTSQNKPHHCFVCSIKSCEYLKNTESGFCYKCVKYPCTRLKQLDKRYRLKYNMSVIENFVVINESGLDAFVALEIIKWKCNNCGGTICVHRGFCLQCKGSK